MMTTWRKWQSPFWLLVIAAIFYWSTVGLKTNPVDMRQTIPQAFRIFAIMFGQMDWSYRGEVLSMMIETVQMAIIGTLMASLLALPFGFLAARNVGKYFSGTGRFFLNAIRAFPELILAIILFKGVGPGPMAGVITMGIHSIGMLGKLYSESVESIDRGPSEAMVSTGANRIQQIWFGVIPQVLPEFTSYAIYRFEINARSATILGIVGAGGIGAPLIFAIQQRVWGRVGIILVGIVVVVSVIDLMSGWLRKRLV